jgi:hypothetical protein
MVPNIRIERASHSLAFDLFSARCWIHPVMSCHVMAKDWNWNCCWTSKNSTLDQSTRLPKFQVSSFSYGEQLSTLGYWDETSGTP